MTDVPHALNVSPDSALQFVLTRGDDGDGKSDGSARCFMTLSHPGTSKNSIAFKVKTTQPRRYLVRPNQGLIAPGGSEKITILLVEKDKQMLLQSFDRLGQSALDHSKDKFLVQSCFVDEGFAQSYNKKKAETDGTGDSQEASKIGKELSDTLTDFWNKSSTDGIPIHNKKLPVKHTAVATAATSRSSSRQEKPNLDSMTPEQMFSEITTLRRKYDELVTFSVNLTAERDILNNTLEQTKRDLNREVARSNARAANGGTQTIKKGSSLVAMIKFLFIAALFFLVGVKAKHLKVVEFLFDVPVLGDALRAEL
jgi:hypothetical protein